MFRWFVIVLSLLLCMAGSAAWGRDLFQVRVQTTDGAPLIERTVGGSSLPDLLEDLIDASGEFDVFAGRNVFAIVRYAGVNEAIHLSVNAAGTEATLHIPRTGFTRTFSDEAGDVEDEVVDWLLEEGAREYAAFLREMNRASKVGVTDGNPRATTAFMADFAFRRHAMHPSWVLADAARPGRGLRTRFDLSAGSISADGFSGSYFMGGWTGTLRFTEQVALSLGIPGQYRRIEGADIFDLGAEVALPIRILTGRRGPLGWQVVPLGMVTGSFSRDMAAGGVMLGGGVSSSLLYRMDAVTLVVGNQLTFHNGTPLRVGGYRLETDLSQQILKNGVKVVYDLDWVYVDGGLTLTNLLRPAAVRNYLTPELGAGFRLTGRTGLRVGYAGEIGRDFRSHSANLAFYWGW